MAAIRCHRAYDGVYLMVVHMRDDGVKADRARDIVVRELAEGVDSFLCMWRVGFKQSHGVIVKGGDAHADRGAHRGENIDVPCDQIGFRDYENRDIVVSEDFERLSCHPCMSLLWRVGVRAVRHADVGVFYVLSGVHLSLEPRDNIVFHPRLERTGDIGGDVAIPACMGAPCIGAERIFPRAGTERVAPWVKG